VAKTKYAFAKQQRELDKQQRKEEKVRQPPTHQGGYQVTPSGSWRNGCLSMKNFTGDGISQGKSSFSDNKS